MRTPGDGASLGQAAALGAVAGLRSLTPLAALAARGRLGHDRAERIAAYAAAGAELVGDKLPKTSPRTSPPGLASRLGTAVLSGWKVAGPAGAALAAGSAGASAVAGQRARAAVDRSTGLPDPLVGLAEDAVAVSLATLTVRLTPGGRGRPGAPARPSPLGAAVRGLAAGAAGTAAMTVAQEVYYKVSGAQPSSTRATVTRKIFHAVGGVEVPDRYEGLLNWGTHVLYGSSLGVALGLVAGTRATAPPVVPTAAAFALAVWGSSAIYLPLLKLSPPVWKWGVSGIATDLGFHLVYAGTAAATLRAIWP